MKSCAQMKIKKILDEQWDKLAVKPFIYVGFHPYQTKVIMLAIANDEILECRVIEDKHEAKQRSFFSLIKRYPGAAVAVSNKRTEFIFYSILSLFKKSQKPLIFLLKGSPKETVQWESELMKFIEGGSDSVCKSGSGNPIEISQFAD